MIRQSMAVRLTSVSEPFIFNGTLLSQEMNISKYKKQAKTHATIKAIILNPVLRYYEDYINFILVRQAW